MAGLDAVAGIVGLTGFAYRLTRSLYEAGSAFTAARKETKCVARNINNYANVLDMLNDIIEKDESLISTKAYNNISDIIDQSYDLFDEIERRLPSTRAPDEDLKVGEKLKWIFRKSRVEPLVKEIDSLKTNVAALQGVLCFGGILKAARVREAKQQTRQSERDRQQLEAHRLRAENSIVEHLEARSDFIRANRRDVSHSEASDNSSESSTAGCDGGKSVFKIGARQRGSLQISIRRNDPLSRFGETLQDVHPHSQRQLIVLQNTHSILQSLLREWIADEGRRADESEYKQEEKLSRNSHVTAGETADARRSTPGIGRKPSGAPQELASVGFGEGANPALRRKHRSTYSPPSPADPMTSTQSAKPTFLEEPGRNGKQEKEPLSFSRSQTMPSLSKTEPKRTGTLTSSDSRHAGTSASKDRSGASPRKPKSRVNPPIRQRPKKPSVLGETYDSDTGNQDPSANSDKWDYERDFLEAKVPTGSMSLHEKAQTYFAKQALRILFTRKPGRTTSSDDEFSPSYARGILAGGMEDVNLTSMIERKSKTQSGIRDDQE